MSKRKPALKKPPHTPGPWTATDDHRGVWEIIHDGDVLIAQAWSVTPGGDGDLPAEANARLMAAAPELLAACEAMLAATDGQAGWQDLTGITRAAIAKAKGGAS